MNERTPVLEREPLPARISGVESLVPSVPPPPGPGRGAGRRSLLALLAGVGAMLARSEDEAP